MREELNSLIGADVSAIKPGSPEAEALKKTLMARGAWSPYLEVGIGPYAEIFTKAPPMAAVGYGAEIGIRSDSDWNNPEPEVTLVVERQGHDRRRHARQRREPARHRKAAARSCWASPRTTTPPARSAPSCACSTRPSRSTTCARPRSISRSPAPTSSACAAPSDLSKISRDPTDLVRHAMGGAHQYPDGMVLMTGTLFAPTEQRKPGGTGFTHMVGDLVSIRSPKLGTLTNTRQPLRQDRAVDLRRVGADAQSRVAGDC